MRNEDRRIQFLFWFYAFSTQILFIYELTVFSDTRENAFFNYSRLKLLELALLFVIVIIFTYFAFYLQKSIDFRKILTQKYSQPNINHLLTYLAISIFLLSVGLLTISEPHIIITKLRFIFIWVLTLSVITFVMLLQNKYKKIKKFSQETKLFSFIFFCIFILLILFSLLYNNSSNRGQSTIYITWPQGLFVVWIGLTADYANLLLKNKPTKNWIVILLSSTLFFFSGFLWQNTGFRGSYNMVGPFSPNNEWFPHSDSARFDAAAQSVLIGEGLNFHRYVDNPLMVNYMVFLHLIMGGSFIKISIFQIWLFACIPVLLFLLAKKLFGFSSGLQCALFYIIRVRNIIAYSFDTGLASPRIFLSEGLLEPLLILFTFFIFNWIESKEKNFQSLIVSSFLFGLSALTRANVWFIFVFSLIFIFFTSQVPFWKRIKKCIIILCATVIILIPWMYRSSYTINTPLFMMYKFQNSVINERYNLIYGEEYLFSPKSDQKQLSVEKQQSNKQITNGTIINVLENSYKRVTKIILMKIENIFDILYENTRLIVYSFTSSFLILPFATFDNSTSVIFPIEFLLNFYELSIISKIQIAINIFLVTTIFSFGIFSLLRKNLLFTVFLLGEYLSYILASSAALTAGSRYSQPVEWIFLVFVSFGFSSINKNFFFPPEYSSEQSKNSRKEENNNNNFFKARWHYFAYSIFIIILISISILMIVPDYLSSQKIPKQNKQEIFDNIAETRNDNFDNKYLNSSDANFGGGRIIYSLPLEPEKEFSHPFFVQRPFLRADGVDSLVLFVISSSGEQWLKFDLPKELWPNTSLVWNNASYIGFYNENKKILEVCELVIQNSENEKKYFQSHNRSKCR